MNAEEYLNDELDGAHQSYDETGIVLINGIEHSEICRIMDEYAEYHHQEKMETAIKLLSVARCPNGNCDNNGTIAYQTQSGDCELEPCQWCHEKQHLTN